MLGFNLINDKGQQVKVMNSLDKTIGYVVHM